MRAREDGEKHDAEEDENGRKGSWRVRRERNGTQRGMGKTSGRQRGKRRISIKMGGTDNRNEKGHEYGKQGR